MHKSMAQSTFLPNRIIVLTIRNDTSAGGWIFPTNSQLPTVTISLGDPNSSTGAQSFTIDPADLAFSDDPDNPG